MLIFSHLAIRRVPLNESPSEKEGKLRSLLRRRLVHSDSLNESPSEKEGKFGDEETHNW